MLTSLRTSSVFAVLVFMAGPVVAQDCPASPDISVEADALLLEMRDVEGPGAARAVSNGLWQLWLRAPDAYAQDLLDDGMRRRSSFDLAGAVAAFDEVVAHCPDYAEGYNQRAFANFIREDFAAALPDLDRAITLSPRHVAAIAGRGLTLIQLGRIREGQEAIRAALELNPWLSERQYLALKPETTDL